MTDPMSIGQKLLEQARAGHDPSAADEARVRAALHARVLASPLLLAPKSPHPLTGVGKLPWGKAAFVLGFGGVAAAVAMVMSQGLGPREPAPRVGQAPAAAVSAPGSGQPSPASADSAVSTTRPELPAPSRALSGPSQKHPATPPAASSAALSTRDMQLEIAGLSRAQQLLHAGNAAQASSALDQLTRQVPRGALMEERDATRALAQCALARASSTADAFIARHPQSVHAARVRGACEPAD